MDSSFFTKQEEVRFLFDVFFAVSTFRLNPTRISYFLLTILDSQSLMTDGSGKSTITINVNASSPCSRLVKPRSIQKVLSTRETSKEDRPPTRTKAGGL